MSDFLQEKKKIVLFIAIILFLLLGLAYLYLITPIKDDVASSKNNVNQLEAEIKSLKAQEKQEPTKENTAKLEKKMPTSRSIDELLRHLQEIELISDSRIDSVSFNNYDGELSETDVAIEKETKNQEDTKAGDESTDGKEDEQAVDEDDNGSDTGEKNAEDTEIPPESDLANDTNLPSNVKLITLNLSVISPDFEHFQQFLQELEKLERITRVDTMNFTKPAERELLYEEDGTESITMDVQITTFYYDSGQ
ncbi:type 4a pilus biogenesis protein PilO [Bacillus andreraoultii]|uniref:type 4a pilus biogenesis protein PilO n=1 Tax=Bacillus andreraoultii TaxID=1499685 RepID=UPI00067EEDC6|nr:type 4a pilus biogenesis protein PilO [Bacillus andreraoultii]